MTEVDWELVGSIGFEAAERAARSVARRWAGVEEEDVFQEALIYLATHPAEAEEAWSYGYELPGVRGGGVGGQKHLTRMLTGRMQRWAEERNGDLLVEQAAWQRSRAKVAEAPDLTRWANRPTPEQYQGQAYTPALVEAALQMLWGDGTADMPRTGMPDHDMPKGASNKAHTGTPLAVYADIRWVWSSGILTPEHRRALLLCYGLGWKHEDIGAVEGISRQAAEARINRAVFTVADWLNDRRA